MKHLAEDLEIGEFLTAQADGSYKLPLEEDLEIDITSLSKGYYLFCNLAPCPKQNQERFYSEALLGNLFGQGTHGAVLGLSDDGNRLVLSRVIDDSIGYKEFKDALEDFINVADLWRVRANES